MSEDVFDRIRRQATRTEQDQNHDDPQERRSEKTISLPAIAVEKRAVKNSLTVPDIRPVARDRRSRREADDARRELWRVVRTTQKHRLVQKAINQIDIDAVEAIDQTQHEMIEILYGRDRHEQMDEMMGKVVRQCLEQFITHTMALSELHFKRQMEEL